MAHVKNGIAHTIRELECGRLDANRGNALFNGYRTFALALGEDLDGKGVQIVVQREPAPPTGQNPVETAQDDSGGADGQPDDARAPAPVYGLPPGGAKA